MQHRQVIIEAVQPQHVSFFTLWMLIFIFIFNLLSFIFNMRSFFVSRLCLIGMFYKHCSFLSSVILNLRISTFLHCKKQINSVYYICATCHYVIRHAIRKVNNYNDCFLSHGLFCAQCIFRFCLHISTFFSWTLNNRH